MPPRRRRRPSAVEVARVIRLTVSAARADGALTDVEQDAIRTRARAVGAEPLVDEELKTPTPLSRLVAGVPATSRNELYTLAFAIVHADGVIAGAERIYLAQLAHALGLSVDDAALVGADRGRTAECTARLRATRRFKMRPPRQRRINQQRHLKYRERAGDTPREEERWLTSSGTWPLAGTRSDLSSQDDV